MEQMPKGDDLDADIVGWIKQAGRGFDNERHFREIVDVHAESWDPKRLRYFERYARIYYHDGFVTGQGTEAILDQLDRFGRPGRWLDLGAATTTFFWSIPLSGISSIHCCDIVGEALVVLTRFGDSEQIPPCYAKVLAMFGKSRGHLWSMRRSLKRLLVFDSLKRWPRQMKDEKFELITAFGNLGIAGDQAAYAEALVEIAAHLGPGGVAIGADWLRKPAYIECDGHDNSYLSVRQVESAAENAGLRTLECRQEAVAGDPHYDGLLCWVLEKPG